MSKHIPQLKRSINKPPILVDLGDNFFLYNYDPKEVITSSYDPNTSKNIEHRHWEYVQSYIKGPVSDEEAIVATLRHFYSIDAELSLLHKYNSYKMGILSDSSIEKEYREFCNFVNDIRNRVHIDLNMEEVPSQSLEESTSKDQG